MILTRRLLDTKYASWFHNKRNTEQAKKEILLVFSEEPDEFHKRGHPGVRPGRKRFGLYLPPQAANSARLF